MMSQATEKYTNKQNKYKKYVYTHNSLRLKSTGNISKLLQYNFFLLEKNKNKITNFKFLLL